MCRQRWKRSQGRRGSHFIMYKWYIWSVHDALQEETRHASIGSPVVAHGLEDGIVKLDGPGDEQGWVVWLRRHVCCG